MRHVADEPRRRRVVPGDLGPLVPADGPPVGEEPVEQRERPLALAKPHERADVADLVRRVGIPVAAAVFSLRELVPVAVERARQGGLGEVPDLAAGHDGNRRRRRIEVAELDGAGDVVDPVIGDGAHDRRVYRLAEGVA